MEIKSRPLLRETSLSELKPEDFLGSQAQYEFLEDLLDGQEREAKLFYKWVLYEMLHRPVLFDSWICIQARDIQKELGWSYTDTKEIWDPLFQANVIDILPATYPKNGPGKARGFLIYPIDVLKFLKRWRGERVDLFTGDKRKGKQHITRLTYDGGTYWSEPLNGALRVLRDGRSLINLPSTTQFLSDRLEELRDKEQEFGGDSDEYKSCRASVCNDLRCWNTIANQNLQDAPDMPDGIYQYDPAWRVQQISGRVSEIGGGGQNCSNEMKSAMRDIEGVKNYDIESSQMNLLKEKLEKANIDTTFIDDVLAKGKEHFAKKLSMDVGLFKQCFYAVYYGATIPNDYDHAVAIARNSSYPLELMELMYEAYEEDLKDDMEQAVDFFEELEDVMKEYADYLLNDRKKKKTRKGEYVKNQCGITVYPEEYEAGHERRSKTMAHDLQGDEAAFIHEITKLSKEYDYEVLANEHDGIIVLGEIPQEAQEKARRKSGFEFANLEVKEFA